MCPMNDYKIKGLNITDNQVATFCKCGCSVDCEKLFNEKFKKQIKREEE